MAYTAAENGAAGSPCQGSDPTELRRWRRDWSDAGGGSTAKRGSGAYTRQRREHHTQTSAGAESSALTHIHERTHTSTRTGSYGSCGVEGIHTALVSTPSLKGHRYTTNTHTPSVVTNGHSRTEPHTGTHLHTTRTRTATHEKAQLHTQLWPEGYRAQAPAAEDAQHTFLEERYDQGRLCLRVCLSVVLSVCSAGG